MSDAHQTFFGLSAAALKHNALWRAKAAARLKPLDAMTPAEKAAFRAQMDARFPKR